MTAFSWVTVKLEPKPAETSVVSRLWARSGDDGPGSTQLG
jgi:hypothetical protein